MQSILNTGNSKSREEALNKIINNMHKSLFCEPLGYKFGGSGCSCCLSEYFYLICKIGSDYKIFMYDGYIEHTNKCAGVRCTCEESFKWKNVNPVEEDMSQNQSEIEYLLETMVSIKDETWKDDYKLFLEQQKENENIQKYNDNDDCDEKSLKNYSYYFNKNNW